MTKTIMSFTIDIELSKEFKEYTDEREINRSEVINRLIRGWLLYQEQANKEET